MPNLPLRLRLHRHFQVLNRPPVVALRVLFHSHTRVVSSLPRVHARTRNSIGVSQTVTSLPSVVSPIILVFVHVGSILTSPAGVTSVVSVVAVVSRVVVLVLSRGVPVEVIPLVSNIVVPASIISAIVKSDVFCESLSDVLKLLVLVVSAPVFALSDIVESGARRAHD